MVVAAAIVVAAAKRRRRSSRERDSFFFSSSSSSSALSLLVRRLLSTPLAPCLAYGAISICITLFNKAVFSVYKFQFPAFVTALQVRRRRRKKETSFCSLELFLRRFF